MKQILSIFLCVCLTLSLLTGCGTEADTQFPETESTAASTAPSTESSPTDSSATDSDLFTQRDCETDYDESAAITIQLNGTSAEASSNSVQISGSTVTITEEATYVISGTLTDGMVIVDVPDTAKLQLVLKNVDITNSTSAALYIKEADKVFVTLVGENTLTSSDTFTTIDENNIDAAVFSKQDLTFNGTGSLTVSAAAGHGITCKDDLVFTGGTYAITAASHAIDANDSVRIQEAVITAEAGKDGIHVENNEDSEKGFVYIASGAITIDSEGDGISASADLQIADGTINILAGGGYENGTQKASQNWGRFGGGMGKMPGGAAPGSGSAPVQGTGVADFSVVTESDSSTSMKGLKAAGNLIITGGTFTIDSADDSLHANAAITVSGGTFAISSGDDGIHADDTLTVTDGTIRISNSYEGLEALHLVVQGGDIQLVATDDGLNAAGGTDQSGMGGRDGMFGGGMSASSNGSIVILGGTLYINASGDGIDANGTLEITGGHTTVTGPTQGDTATLDYDVSGIINGGTFIGTGASNMAQTFSASSQGVIAVSVGNQAAGTKITLTDKNGNEILSHTPELAYQVIILSCPDLEPGETYTLTVGTQSGEVTAS